MTIIREKDGVCKHAPTQLPRVHTKKNLTSVKSNEKASPISYSLRALSASTPAAEAERKAKTAMNFAREHESSNREAFKSAWLEGGAHCLLAAFSPFSQELRELITTSSVAAVEHTVHIADELDKMGMVNMPNRRRRKEQNKYLGKMLEAYMLSFFTIPVELTLARLQPDVGFAGTLERFIAMVQELRGDISSHGLLTNRQPISTLMLQHVREGVDRADVIEFIASYDPFIRRSNALGKRQTDRLARRTKERLQAVAPYRIAYDVALATVRTQMPTPASNGLPTLDTAA